MHFFVSLCSKGKLIKAHRSIYADFLKTLVSAQRLSKWKAELIKAAMMNGDGMNDVELRSVALQAPLNRSLTKDPDLIEHVVETQFGKVTVAIRGDRQKPALLTYHDLGLNSVSNFQAFTNYPEMADILRNFCIFHINAPGQEDNAGPWPESVPYPSMDDLAEQVSIYFKQTVEQ